MVLGLALPSAARAAASFTVDPNPATVCRPAEFTAQPDPDLQAGETVTDYAWDLDGDGLFDDATTATATHTFSSAAAVNVGLQISYVDAAQQSRVEEVRSAVPVAAAAPKASFTRAPSAPLTFDPVTYRSTSTVPVGQQLLARAWDLNGDGVFGDATAAVASTSYGTPGPRIVRLRILSGCGGPAFTGETAQIVPVGNRLPTASIRLVPTEPLVGASVDFISLARDRDGPIVFELWDLDRDGRFDDALGPTATRAFPTAGTKVISLLAIDASGATVRAFASFNVVPLKPPDPSLLSPFPVVRMVGEILPTGTRIKVLTVRAPRASRVTIKCSGGGCPYRRRSVRTRSSRLRVRSLRRVLEPRAKLRIYVTKADAIGKYTSFRIRRGRPPARRDLCLKPGAARPSRCPVR